MGLPAQPDDARRIVVTADDGRRVVLRTDDSVHSVTSAQTGLSEEQRARTRRYLISMAIRTVCFLAAVFASGWWQWLFLAGAVFLPYVAVVMANAGRENDDFEAPAPVTPVPAGQLPAAQSEAGGTPK